MSPWLKLFSLTVLVCLPGVAAADSGGFVTQGALVVRRGRAVVKVPLEHTRVHIRVAGHLAHATVSQTFKNPYPKKIEAVYVFPLPTNAAVRGYALKVGQRVIRGELLRRGEARAVYRRAREAGKVAALLTQERPNIFTQRVANLEPGKKVQIQVSYVSALPYDSGTRELVFPMVTGPRFVLRKKGAPPSARLSSPMLPPALRSGHDISLRVDLQAGLPVSALHSPSHLIRVTRHGQKTRVEIDATDSIPNKDFVLRYTVAGLRPRAAALTHRPAPGAAGHLMLTVQPPEERFPANVAPRELIFVVDTSSSMTGAPLDKAVELVAFSLRNLGPRDTFQIVRFSDGSASLGPSMIANRPRNVKLALTWLRGLRAAGGTRVIRGVEAALALPHDPGRLRMVVFITDGYVGNEAQILSLVSRRMGASRLFSFGVGTAVNRYLLEEMATLGRGAVQVVRPDEPTAAAVDRFFARICSPVLTDLSVELTGGLRFTEAAPARLPDLFVGQPLVLRARLHGAGAGVAVVRGRSGSGEGVRLEVPVVFPRARHGNPALALTWARARITTLQRRQLRDRDPRLREQITRLALTHGLLTRYTAFVAVDQRSATRGTGSTVFVPVDRPQGMMGAQGSKGGLGFPSGGHRGVAFGRAASGIGSVSLGSRPVHAYAPLAGLRAREGSGHGYSGGPALRMASRRVVPVPLMMARAEVRNHFDSAAIRRVVRARINQVRYCYERELASSPGLAGKVVVGFTFDGDRGKVISVRVRSSTLGSPGAEACILRAIKGWTFPRTPGAGLCEVSYPFVFVRSAQSRRR